MSAYERSLQDHQLKAFFIDDGQQLIVKHPEDELNMLLSLAIRTKVPHVIFGSYDLMPFLIMSAQAGNRIQWLEFPRYQWDARGRKAYDEVVQSFQRKLPGALNLQPRLPYLYQRTLGCVGILKGWLTRTLGSTLRQRGNAPTLNLLNETSLKGNQLSYLLEESIKGENTIQSLRHVAAPGAKQRGPAPGKQAVAAATAVRASRRATKLLAATLGARKAGKKRLRRV
jgi:hypothetical protein